jgi:hypothetical protein
MTLTANKKKATAAPKHKMPRVRFMTFLDADGLERRARLD